MRPFFISNKHIEGQHHIYDIKTLPDQTYLLPNWIIVLLLKFNFGLITENTRAELAQELTTTNILL